jgi:uncharacterized protein (TIGR03435 family)
VGRAAELNLRNGETGRREVTSRRLSFSWVKPGYDTGQEERSVLRISLGLVLAAAAWAQPAAERSTFEVASVKRSAKQGMTTRMSGGPGTSDPGRFRATNAELSMLVMRAYGIQYDQLIGPAWMDKTQFDIAANVPPGTTSEELRKMLQNLLAERFRMQVHRETRVLPVYELTVAKNGPKLKRAAEGSGTDDFVPGSGPRPMDRDNFPILPPGRSNIACRYGPDGGRCTFRKVSVEVLAQRLSGPTMAGVGRRVVDKTGLTGAYDFTLYFRPNEGPESDAPGIEQAVQEQLGLKLISSKASIDMLVIDHAEPPVQN